MKKVFKIYGMSLREMIYTTGVPEEEVEKEEESLYKEITVEDFPNLMRDLDIQGHEAKI